MYVRFHVLPHNELIHASLRHRTQTYAPVGQLPLSARSASHEEVTPHYGTR